MIQIRGDGMLQVAERGAPAQRSSKDHLASLPWLQVIHSRAAAIRRCGRALHAARQDEPPRDARLRRRPARAHAQPRQGPTLRDALDGIALSTTTTTTPGDEDPINPGGMMSSSSSSARRRGRAAPPAPWCGGPAARRDQRRRGRRRGHVARTAMSSRCCRRSAPTTSPRCRGGRVAGTPCEDGHRRRDAADTPPTPQTLRRLRRSRSRLRSRRVGCF
mmetsp:Transcript_14933/g.59910  ORF Transcript_14933/g.59910 Transcript_14933/m.59910 type:complete len:218 (+) Transcript_14933:1891-2544(+)